MAESEFENTLEDLRNQLNSGRQNWLFGAGISCNANIPLMYPLTARVKALIESSGTPKDLEIYHHLTNELDTDSHIEHYLSHIGDLIALADRSKTKSSTLSGDIYKTEEFSNLHKKIIWAIGETVRYGYSNDESEEIGTSEKPIIKIEHHLNFVKALYSSRSNLLSRSKLTFFTTNYDTLLEDALGLEKFIVVDGFSGGSVGYWNPQFEFQQTNNFPNKCLLFKLHGSIDWQRDENRGLIRNRYGTNYLTNKSDIMIYPQATKYVETQKDPFSYLFNGFRSALNFSDDNVLITCGYSFGDEHINAEIEAALGERNNKTTVIAFIKEKPDASVVVNKTLDSWLVDENFGNRIYVAGQNGLYYNSVEPKKPEEVQAFDWWTFSGLTNFILSGEYE